MLIPAWHVHSFFPIGSNLRQLFEAVGRLDQAAESLGLARAATREWYQTLRHKLLPQLADDAFLVVAVVGGTNIGKSVIFNHIAGNRVSATSPLASGTRHPVCLVPTDFEKQHDLPAIYEGFHLEPWSQAEQAFETGDDDRLFWRTCADAPANLLVLDTPDIDSQVEINWRRADMIRRAADVLIAVLTQQKYNDAAVKQFFRKAAVEDKSIIVVFNQCELPEDDAYWPLWLETFCSETRIAPQMVYVVPSDRRAAEGNELPFYDCTGYDGAWDNGLQARRAGILQRQSRAAASGGTCATTCRSCVLRRSSCGRCAARSSRFWIAASACPVT